MRNLIALLMIIMLAVFACNEKNDVSLEKCWALAEKDNDFQIFYICGDDRLTRSWFRPRYHFYPNNKCEYLVLSPNDAHYMKEGKYVYDRQTATLTVRSLDDHLIAKFRILAIEEDLLKVKEL